MKQSINLCGENTYLISRFIDSRIMKVYIATSNPQLLVTTSNLGNEKFKEVSKRLTKVKAFLPNCIFAREEAPDVALLGKKSSYCIFARGKSSYVIETKVALLTYFYNEGYDYEKLDSYAQGLAIDSNVGRAMRKHKQFFAEYFIN